MTSGPPVQLYIPTEDSSSLNTLPIAQPQSLSKCCCCYFDVHNWCRMPKLSMDQVLLFAIAFIQFICNIIVIYLLSKDPIGIIQYSYPDDPTHELHNWNCIHYEAYLIVMLIVSSLVCIATWRRLTGSSVGTQALILSMWILLYIAQMLVFIFSHALNGGPSSEYSQQPITQEGYEIYHNSGCVKYMTRYHSGIYVAAHILLPLPALLTISCIIVYCIAYVIFYLYKAICTNQVCDENGKCIQDQESQK